MPQLGPNFQLLNTQPQSPQMQVYSGSPQSDGGIGGILGGLGDIAGALRGVFGRNTVSAANQAINTSMQNATPQQIASGVLPQSMLPSNANTQPQRGSSLPQSLTSNTLTNQGRNIMYRAPGVLGDSAATSPTSSNTNKNVNDLTLNTIKHFEGFISKPAWDVNAYRVGYGSDTITKADGSVVRVRPGMQVTQEDANRDLVRRTEQFQKNTINQVGENNWQRLNPGAHAALTSISYNYGRLPNKVAEAARTGDPTQLYNAIRGLGSDNKGINRHRRYQEANMILQDEGAQKGYSPVPIQNAQGSPNRQPSVLGQL